jgi:hypothetical protein
LADREGSAAAAVSVEAILAVHLAVLAVLQLCLYTLK